MKIHQISYNEVFDYIKRNPGLPEKQISIYFRKHDLNWTLSKLGRMGLIESKIEAKGIVRNWMVKCYYPIEMKKGVK